MYPRLIPQPEEPRQVFVTIRSRPFRIAFIVNRSIEQDDLIKVIQYNCCIWGGRYNLFVPTDGSTIREDWWHILIDYDPDKVVYVGVVEDALVDHIYNHVQPFEQISWGDAFIERLAEHGIETLNGITIPRLLQYLADVEGIVDQSQSNYVYPRIAESPFALYFQLLAGNYLVDGYSEYYKHVLGAEEINCSPQTFEDYLLTLSVLSKKMTPLRFTRTKIDRIAFTNAHLPFGVAVIITDGLYEDFFIYHALSWYYSPNDLYIVSSSALNDEASIQILAEWINQQETSANWITLLSSSLDLDYLRKLRDQIRPFLHGSLEMLDIRHCNFEVNCPDVFVNERQSYILIKDQVFPYGVPDLEFGKYLNNSSYWVTELDLSPRLLNRDGFVPSKFPELNDVLAGHKPEHRRAYHMLTGIRVARKKLALVSSKDNHVGSIRLPTPQELFTTLFEDYSYMVSRDEKGRYYQGMVKLAGGLRDLVILRDEGFLDLFSDRDMLEGKALTLKTIFQKVKPGDRDNRERFLDSLQLLASKTILLRGFNQRCPNCDLQTWYQVTALDEHLVCSGCRSVFQVPIDLYCAYRLNQLFIQGINQGARTTLLTALLLDEIRRNSLLWDVGYKVRNMGEPIDIDLVAMCDGLLVIAECKDSFSTIEDDIQHDITQLERSIAVARSINVDVFFLTTLSPTAPQAIETFIAETHASEQRLSIHLIKRDDLMRGHLLKGPNSDQRKHIDDLQKIFPRFRYKGECSESDPASSSGGWRKTRILI